MYEIKPLKDGYAVYKDGKQVTWVYCYELAQHRVEQMQQEDKKA